MSAKAAVKTGGATRPSWFHHETPLTETSTKTASVSENAANAPHTTAALAHRLAGPGCSQKLFLGKSSG